MREMICLSEGEWVRNPQDNEGSLLGGGDPSQREDINWETKMEVRGHRSVAVIKQGRSFSFYY